MDHGLEQMKRNAVAFGRLGDHVVKALVAVGLFGARLLGLPHGFAHEHLVFGGGRGVGKMHHALRVHIQVNIGQRQRVDHHGQCDSQRADCQGFHPFACVRRHLRLSP